MCDMEIKVNGNPVMNTEFKNELEQAAIQAMLEKLGSRISVELTPEEISQITVSSITGTISNLSFHTSGPEEVINKIRKALNQLFNR